VQVIHGSDGTTDTFYVTTDHLGSTDAVLNAAGTVLLQGSFGVHGARRASNWQGAPSSTEWQAIADTTRRGYTGHEQIDNVMVVHMNGRVFDPVIGRFLSADPYIDGPETTHGWNRYAYVHGRLLSATDPTGYDYLGNLATTTASRCVDSWALACNVNMDPNFLDNIMANSRYFGQPASPLTSNSGGSAAVPVESIEEVVVEEKKCTPPDDNRSSGDIVADTVVGFGDAFLIPIIVRHFADIDGSVDTGSAAYAGGNVAGIVVGFVPFAFEGAVAYSAAQAARGTPSVLNANRIIRIGPGRMPRNGSLPPGTKVPRLSVGTDGLHVDLRRRIPPVPPLGAPVGGDGC
jgi:RHS repeat-associated protein